MDKKLIYFKPENLTFPKIPTHKNVRDYLISKNCSEQAYTCHYVDERVCFNPRLDLMLAIHSYDKVKQELECKRELAKEAKKRLKEQWEDLYKEETNLKETFCSCVKFIATNASKKERAEIRMEEDRKIFLERSKLVEERKAKLAKAKYVKQMMDEDIRKLAKFEDFVGSVLNISDNYKTPFDIMNRYDILVSTKHDLGKRQEAALEELEQNRARTGKAMGNALLLLVGKYTTVAEMHDRYYATMRKLLLWENVINSIKNEIYRRHKEICAVKQSCWSLYKMMSFRKGEVVKVEDEDNFEKQLMFIKKTLQEQDSIRVRATTSILTKAN